MNTVITSKEAIIEASQKIAYETGLQTINIRNVAASCGVSVGSVYNYFPSKVELIAATVKKVWEDIFNNARESQIPTEFIPYIIWLYDTIQNSSAVYPSFFTLHSMSFAVSDKEKGREVMDQYFNHIKAGMLRTLLYDAEIPQTVFTATFTPMDFVNFIFTNILSLSMQNIKSCDTLLEIIKRIIT